MTSRLAILTILAILHAASGAHPNPYHILGVSRTDSVDEVKSAFRNLAKKWHPDKSSSVEVFSRIREAYDVLTDADKRNYYDRIGKYPSSKQNHISVDIQDYAIQKYASLGALHLYNQDPDRFSPTTLLTEETYSLLVETDVLQFGTIWIVKLYANRCSSCSAISSTWESLIENYQGSVSFGRINYDLSVGLVRVLDLRSIPEIVAVTRSSRGDGVVLTRLLDGDLKRLSQSNFAQTLYSLRRPNDFATIKSRDELDRFLSENKDAVKIVFNSRLQRDVPVSLLAFMFRSDLPKRVRYAFAGNLVSQSGSAPQSVSVWRDGKEETISVLSDWDQLLSVDMGSHVIPILERRAVPVFPKLTYENYYDICYADDAVCVIIIADDDSTARRHFGDLRDLMDVSNAESRVRIAWVEFSQQIQFVDHLGLSASIRSHKVGFCVVRPRMQIFLALSDSGSEPNDRNQVRTWLSAAINTLLESQTLTRSAIPYLRPGDSRSSLFSPKLTEFFNWGWYLFTLILYCTLALAAMSLLFIGPSFM